MSEVRIFSGKSASFDSVGEKLDAVVCIPHRILNGAYNGTISIPFDSVNSDLFVFGAVVRCSSGKKAGEVQFDLYRLGQPTVQVAIGGSYKTADLWHISNDLGNPKIMSKYLEAQTGQQALTALLTASADEQRFSGTTDITAMNNLRLELMSPQAGLMNTAGPCFINTWGGETERDNFAFNIWQRLGSDKGYQIELGKNLTGVTETPTGTGYTNRIIPSCKWSAMDSSVLTALKADIDVEKVANNTRADDENTATHQACDIQYDLELVNAAAKRESIYAQAEAQYLIDGSDAARSVTYTFASNQYDQTVVDAAYNRDRDKTAADARCVEKKAQAQLYADEMKAVADKRFSDLADERKKDVFLPEGYIDSPNPNVWDNLKHTKYYPCTSIRIGEMNTDTGVIDYPDLESAYNAMRSIVANLYTMGADVPGVSVKIDFVNLGDTKECKSVAMLQSLDVQLGDTVHCKYYGRDISLRVCEDYWNSLSDRYESITIGSVVQNIAQSMYAQDVSLEGLKSEMNAVLKQGEAYNRCSITHEDGFVAEATIGGKLVKTYMNATDGLKITVDGVKKFFVGTDGRVYATSIGNTPGYYAEIGIHDENGGGSGMDLFYNNVLFCSIDYLAGGGFAFFDKNGKLRFSAETETTRLYDATGQTRFFADATSTRLFDAAGKDRFYANATSTRLFDAAGKAVFESNAEQTAMRLSGAADTAISLVSNGAFLYLSGVSHPISYT